MTADDLDAIHCLIHNALDAREQSAARHAPLVEEYAETTVNLLAGMPAVLAELRRMAADDWRLACAVPVQVAPLVIAPGVPSQCPGAVFIFARFVARKPAQANGVLEAMRRGT